MLVGGNCSTVSITQFEVARPSAARRSSPSKASRPRYVRSVPYSVCDRDRLGNVISDLGEQRLDPEKSSSAGAEHVLSCNLPAEATVVDTKVEAETLILGQTTWKNRPVSTYRASFKPLATACLGPRGGRTFGEEWQPGDTARRCRYA